jgi:hypothetical protein
VARMCVRNPLTLGIAGSGFGVQSCFQNSLALGHVVATGPRAVTHLGVKAYISAQPVSPKALGGRIFED